MITIKEERQYPFVTNGQHATRGYPNLCTYTVDGEFGFVFCMTGKEHEAKQCEAVMKYINETNSGLVEHIRFS